ncbi:MAG: galactose oxidase [Monoraphidium minutum]|nr:MAG: galactose oxidase [Monoraphidium minutum]
MLKHGRFLQRSVGPQGVFHRTRTPRKARSSTAMESVKVAVQEAAPDAPFLPRSGACAAPLPAGAGPAAILIGGYVEEADKKRSATNEAWVFDRGGGGSWSLVPYAPGPAPGPRIASQCVLVGDDVWLIGGWDPSQQGPGAFLDDIWRLSTKDWSWAKVEPQGEQLGGGISRFQAAAVGDVIYIHTHRTSDHILALDASTAPPTLRRLPVKPDPEAGAPSARGLHSVTHVGGGLVLFGGAPQSGPMMGDLWRLDLASLAWRKLSPAGPAPHVRCSHLAAAAGPARLLVVGGAFYGSSGGLEMLGDAFIYDLDKNAWEEVVPTGGALPSPRNAAVGVPLSPPAAGASLDLLAHGGWRAFVESYNDTCIISV